jgi:hypothetical protein
MNHWLLTRSSPTKYKTSALFSDRLIRILFDETCLKLDPIDHTGKMVVGLKNLLDLAIRDANGSQCQDSSSWSSSIWTSRSLRCACPSTKHSYPNLNPHEHSDIYRRMQCVAEIKQLMNGERRPSSSQHYIQLNANLAGPTSRHLTSMAAHGR